MKTRSGAAAMVAHLRRCAPGLAAALVDERDVLMAERLLQLRGTTVAVVGLAHVDGIERAWQAAQYAGGAAEGSGRGRGLGGGT